MPRKFGTATRTINVEEEDVVEVIRKETNGEMCDVVVDVSGNPNAILKSVDCLHPPVDDGPWRLDRRHNRNADAYG